jgi:hypothetical protein
MWPPRLLLFAHGAKAPMWHAGSFPAKYCTVLFCTLLSNLKLAHRLVQCGLESPTTQPVKERVTLQVR